MSEGSCRLSATGVICHTIKGVSPSNFHHEANWWRDWVLPHSSCFLQTPDMPFLQALFRTMLLDTEESGPTCTSPVRFNKARPTICDLAAGFLRNMKHSLGRSLSNDSEICRNVCSYQTHLALPHCSLPERINDETLSRVLPDLFSGVSDSPLPAGFDINKSHRNVFYERIRPGLHRKRLFVTDDGNIGVAPEFCEESDIV